jgi:hypothetical protein
VPRRIASFVLLALTVPAATACGAPAELSGTCDRYAAPWGSDRAAGTADAPLRTAQQLADGLRPGQTGCLRGGLYTDTPNEDYAVRFDHGGRDGQPITLRSAPGERATLRGIVDVPADADHVAIGALAIEGTGEQNTVKVYATDVLIDGNDITNRGREHSCMFLGSPEAGAAIDVVVRHNYLHDCGSHANDNKDHGIYAAKMRGGEIAENLIVNPAAYAIQLYPDSNDVHVARNVIDGGGAVRGGIVVGGGEDTASSRNTIEHNVIAHTATAPVTGYWPEDRGAANVVAGNCVHDGERFDLTELTVQGTVRADPGFQDRANRDYRLRAGSPCLGVLGGVDVVERLVALGLTPAAGPLPPPPARTASRGSRARARAACRRFKKPARRKRCRARVARRG